MNKKERRSNKYVRELKHNSYNEKQKDKLGRTCMARLRTDNWGQVTSGSRRAKDRPVVQNKDG